MLATATTQTPPSAENSKRPFVVAKNLANIIPYRVSVTVW